jgi:apolipoprotein N-acyltransferase
MDSKMTTKLKRNQRTKSNVSNRPHDPVPLRVVHSTDDDQDCESLSQVGDSAEQHVALAWMRTPFALSMISGLMYWAALPTFPGTFLSLLAWFAPLGWLVLIGQRQLLGKRPLLQIYAAAFIHCLMVYYFVRLPHWAANFGWIALAWYLAFYPFAFILITRVAVHRLRIPIMAAAPIVWVGLELFRGHFLTGLSTALLGHSQIHWQQLIQIADIAGVYGISFVMMLFATAVYLCCFQRSASRMHSFAPICIALALITAAIYYGHFRTHGEFIDNSVSPVRFALVQGSIDTIFPSTEEEYDSHITQTRSQYRLLTVQARQENPDIDYIVWPETMFTDPDLVLLDENLAKLPPQDAADVKAYQAQHPLLVQHALGTIEIDSARRSFAEQLPPIKAIIGITTQFPGSEQHYNSAVLTDENGVVVDRYAKMHRVTFGEYIPFGGWIPALYQLAPISAPLTAGTEPVAFRTESLRVSPNICFESIVPHLIRRQANELENRGQRPDVLLNLTNDGWFWGANVLDLHLTCNAFRAIELRRPVLVCANTGFSAEIDAAGVVRQRGPRRDTGVLIADVLPDRRRSLYQKIGDWPAGICLALTALFAFVGLTDRFRK